MKAQTRDHATILAGEAVDGVSGHVKAQTRDHDTILEGEAVEGERVPRSPSWGRHLNSEEFDEKEGTDFSEGDHMQGFHGEDNMEGGLERYFIGDEEEVETSGRSFDDDDEGEEKFGKLTELPAFTGTGKVKKNKAARGRKKRAADTEERDLAMLELAEKVGNSICASGLDLCVNEELWDASLSSGLDLSIVEFRAFARCATRCIAKMRAKF